MLRVGYDRKNDGTYLIAYHFLDKLKTTVKRALTTEPNRIKIAGVIPSGPGPLLTSTKSAPDRRQELAGHTQHLFPFIINEY
jgi:hypothetical protein